MAYNSAVARILQRVMCADVLRKQQNGQLVRIYAELRGDGPWNFTFYTKAGFRTVIEGTDPKDALARAKKAQPNIALTMEQCAIVVDGLSDGFIYDCERGLWIER